jgi:hypothetical protein
MSRHEQKRYRRLPENLVQTRAGSSTKVSNYAGYVRKYQFGESALIDFGYYNNESEILRSFTKKLRMNGDVRQTFDP